MERPLVSFCFSTYQRKDYLRKTLQSISLQTFGDYEVIISDNDPLASSSEVVKAIGDPRFKYFANGENLGMIKSYNKSIERSSGEFIVMIADDDPVYPHLLETLIDLKEKYPGYGMYMGGCDWFCADKEVARLYNLKIGTNSCISNEHNLDHVQVFSTAGFVKAVFSFQIFSHYLWSTCMVRRDVLIRHGGVPDYGTPFLGDYAYLTMASTEKGCVVINRALGCQTIHAQNFGRNQNDQLPVVTAKFPAAPAARRRRCRTARRSCSCRRRCPWMR